MGRLVSSFTVVAGAAGDAVPYRDMIVFSATLLSMMCLAAAVAVCISARRQGWVVRVLPDD